MDFNSKYKSSEIERILDSVGGKQDAITDLEVIREGASKGATAVQPSDIPEETYLADFTMFSLRQGIDNGSQVNCDINSLIEAMAANKTILVREDEESDGYKGVCVLNGYAEDLLYFSIVDHAGDILYCEGTNYTNTSSYIDGRTLYVRRWDDKQDALVSGENIKTINGESIVGEGDITITGGSGEKGDKGDKGDTGPQGPQGEDGVGIASVTQTTTSTADGGTNEVTVTLSNGRTSTFNVKNGSKGSNGTNGTNGKDGVTFTPSVDSEGNLSWTNNGGLANPPRVNIKGPKGDAGSGGGTITEIKANGTSVATSGVANIPAATTSAYGVTKLTSSTSSTSTTLAATASAVKSAYDLANSYKGTVTGVKINGTTKSPTSGTVDVGNVVTSIKVNGSTYSPSRGVINLGTINGGDGSSGIEGKEFIEKEPVFEPVGYVAVFTQSDPMEPNKVYVISQPIVTLYVNYINEGGGIGDEYTIMFTAGEESPLITISDYQVYWANGTIPSIAVGDMCELSLVRIGNVMKATLEIFKAV